MKRFTLFSTLIVLVFSSCIRFGNQDCDDAQPIVPEGAILSNPYGSCGENGFFKVFPGQAVGFGYSMNLGPGYRNLDIRWKISSDIFFDELTDEAMGKEKTFPYIRNYGGSSTDLRNMDITLYPLIADNNIGKGNIESTVQSIAFNECGESLPATARIEVVNTGNLIQTIRPAPPVKVGFHAQVFYNNKLFLLFGKRDNLNSRDNYVFDLNSKQWSVLTAFVPTGTPDWDPDQNVLLQSLYGTPQNDPTFSWAQIDSKVYIFAPGINYLIEFDLNTQTFKNISAKPNYYGPYTLTYMVAYKGKIYLTPVEVNRVNSNPSTLYFYSFDPSTLQWEQEAGYEHGTVRPPTVIGNPGEMGNFTKMAHIKNDQVVIVYDGNQAIYFDIASKTISNGSDNYMSNVDVFPLWGFDFLDSFYFFHKNKQGHYFLYEKSFAGIKPAFNFFACPRQGIDQIYWSRGARATVAGNTVFIGSEVHGLFRVWLNE